MAQRRQEIEAFMRRLVVEVEAAEAAGMTAPPAIADHFNTKGITTRKGRRWTGATVAKFLSSPGAAQGARAVSRPSIRIMNKNLRSRRHHPVDLGDEIAQMERLGQHLGSRRRLHIRVERDGGKAGDEHDLKIRIEF